MESVSLYSEARNEYLKQMATWIVPPLVEFFRKEFHEIAQREGRRAMTVFQTWCSEVPRWNQDVIDGNVNALLDSCRCDYVEDLMTAVFIAHTKMLTAIRVNTRQKKLQITLPKLDHFLHRVFVECARAFWKAPFLFVEYASPVEMQKNVLQAESMCTEALSGAVRSLLPVKSILRDNLEEDDASSSSSEDEEKVPVVSRKKSKQIRSPSFKKSVGGVTGTVTAPVVEVPSPEKEKEEEMSESDEEEDDVEKVTQPVEFDSPETSNIIPSEPGTPNDETPSEVESPTFSVPEMELIDEQTKNLHASEPIKHVSLIKEEQTLPEIPPSPQPSEPSPEEFIVDTEPSVHFTPYDTVYDETTPNVSEIRYAPKQSVEDLPPSTWGLEDDDDVFALPSIDIMGDSEMSMNGLDILEDLNPPTVSDEEDGPMDLVEGDFETLS